MDVKDVNRHAVAFVTNLDWPEDKWFLKLTVNLLSYSTIIVPFYLLILLIRTKERFANADLAGLKYGWFNRLLSLFAIGRPNYTVDNQQQLEGASASRFVVTVERRMLPKWARLCVCFLGLTFFYVSCGWLQEKLMTKPYQRIDGTGEDRFRDSQFLVFINRLFAFILSGLYIICNWQKQPVHTAPFYEYFFASFANIMSSWCQYEALKFVTFPIQTICKASKIIPVMVMGALISGTKYPAHQYATATLLALGVSLFFLSSESFKLRKVMHTEFTTTSGVLLMVGYMFFDAFTPNWQARLYTYKPKVSSYQMMCGVNCFSAVLCFVSLVERHDLFTSFTFMLTHYGLLRDCILISTFGAFGQIFIYKTIKQFGAVVFTLIMTIRQILSIILSCIYYGHSISTIGGFGLVLACASLFFFHIMKTRH